MTASCVPRHPDHDAVVAEVRRWQTESFPAMGYVRERRRFGVYSRNVHLSFMNSVLIDALAPEEIPALLEEVRRFYGDAEIDVSIDDPERDAVIGPALVAAGLERGRAFLTLVHVGELPGAGTVPELVIEELTEADIVPFSVAKIKGFLSDEAEPTPDRLTVENAFRRVEMAGDGRGLLARVSGEVAAVLSFYEGRDRGIGILTARLPFRERGIARALLCHLLADSHARGCRSVVIGADPEDTPITFYRRLGFTDPVYWSRGYSLPGLTEQPRPVSL